MKSKSIVLILLAAAFVLLTLAPRTQAAYVQNPTTLTVFAASSLTDAFNEIKSAFESAHAGIKVVYSFGSSSTLATQLIQGAPADVFASANAKQMSVAVDGKRIVGKPVTFAKNRLVLIVPIDNPAKITSLKDIAKPGVKLVIAAKNVPVRDYTNTMLDKLAQTPGYGDDYKAAFLKNVVSEEDNVRQVSAKVALGEADAGFVYRSDVTPDLKSKVAMIEIPDAPNTIASYPIAITNDSANPEMAQKYIDYLLSADGQNILVRWNFITAVIPAPTATPMVTPDKPGKPNWAIMAYYSRVSPYPMQAERIGINRI